VTGTPPAPGPTALLAVLADETRWRILTDLGAAEMSASALATRLPVTRQAIAKHLAVLAEAGLVESVRAGREIRYRALGARLSALGTELTVIGQQWDRRLLAIKRIAEGLDDRA
jgi:DNA-binding transcriptional ArsR family regulator